MIDYWHLTKSYKSFVIFIEIVEIKLLFFGAMFLLRFTEQPSSSSLSTTTSSVTSMTSLEHESNDTSVSASDYGNDMASDYGNDGWDVAGDMDVCTKWRSIYESFLKNCILLSLIDITRSKQSISSYAIINKFTIDISHIESSSAECRSTGRMVME